MLSVAQIHGSSKKIWIQEQLAFALTPADRDKLMGINDYFSPVDGSWYLVVFPLHCLPAWDGASSAFPVDCVGC